MGRGERNRRGRGPYHEWRELNRVIAESRLRFTDIEKRLLEIMWRLDMLWREGLIDQGSYRQKGNYYRDTILALIRARCLDYGINIEIREAMLRGRTDHVHKVDFAFIHSGVPIVAGEVKALGSPPHRIGTRMYPERNVNIDIDKRIKEVKYTPIDLKRRLDPDVGDTWDKWIQKTLPKFYSFWLIRLGSRDNLNHIISKLAGISEYNNGVSAVIYIEVEGTYKYVFKGGEALYDVDKLTMIIAREIVDFVASYG